jgi:undecaprenyl-diphosphatase
VQSDAAIFHALQGLRSPVADRVMIAVTELGDPAVVVSVSLAVALFLAWRRAWRAAAYCLCAGLGGWGLNTAVKVAMHRPRPLDLSYSGWSAFSFPSGHTTLNLVVYGFLAFLVARELRFAWRLPVALAAAAWSLLIAFSRLYLGAHWYSDVVGGLALGTSWLALVGFCYTRRPADRIAPSSLLIVAGLALALAGSVNVALRHGPDLVRYGVSVNAP